LHVAVESLSDTRCDRDDEYVNNDFPDDDDELTTDDWPDQNPLIEQNGARSGVEARRNISSVRETPDVLPMDFDEDNPLDAPDIVPAPSQIIPERLPQTYFPAKTANDPSFVSEFYTHSRLHHISTWGSEYKAYVTALQSTVEPVAFSGRERLREVVGGGQDRDTAGSVGGKPRRVIMHIDMDCFFVSVGLLSRPELKGNSAV